MNYKTGFILICLLLSLPGCGDSEENPLWGQLDQLGDQKTELKLQVEQLEKENLELKDQLANLSAIDSQARLDALPKLDRIELAKRTGLYDKDKNPGREKLIVYIRPIDTSGDAVKVPGAVRVQLWNLDNEPASESLLSQWEIQPDQMNQMWAGTLMTNYYRLTFDIADLVTDADRQLTVKVDFTDYINGKLLQAQKVITIP